MKASSLNKISAEVSVHRPTQSFRSTFPIRFPRALTTHTHTCIYVNISLCVHNYNYSYAAYATPSTTSTDAARYVMSSATLA